MESGTNARKKEIHGTRKYIYKEDLGMGKGFHVCCWIPSGIQSDYSVKIL